MPAPLSEARKRKGRPPLPDNAGRRRLIGIAVNAEEDRIIREAAAAAKMPLSAWIRTRALAGLT